MMILTTLVATMIIPAVTAFYQYENNMSTLEFMDPKTNEVFHSTKVFGFECKAR